jgi:hypothetical protein
MGAKRAGKDIDAVIRDRTAIDEAFGLAFGDAVRRHRAGNVPLVLWRNDRIEHVDPWEIKLPGEPGYEEQATE